MAPPKFIFLLFQLSTIFLIILTFPTAECQNTIATPCTGSMITSFTPCMGFLTNSSANGGSPTTDCCNSLKSLMNSGLNCLCLLVTASVPFQLPVNRTLAISLPRACNMGGLPVQCKASVAPIPAPGPAALGPTPFTGDSPSSSPRASAVPQPLSPPLTPPSDTTPVLNPPLDGLTPPSPIVGSETPATNSDGLMPSAAPKPCISLPLLLMLAPIYIGATMFNYY